MSEALMIKGLIGGFIVLLVAMVLMVRDLLPSRRRAVLRRLSTRDPKHRRELGMGYAGLGMMEDDGLIAGVKQPDGRRFYVITSRGVDYLLRVW